MPEATISRAGAVATPVALPAKRLKVREEAIRWGLFLCAALSVITTMCIIWVLFSEAFPLLRMVSLQDFLFGKRWSPILEPRSFGVLPLVVGTLMIVAGASLVALPIGLASAIYLSEYATRRIRNSLKPILEVLAGIPTIVYGYFALTFITPLLRDIFGERVKVFNAASGAIVVGIMILPMVASLCDDALRAVPRTLREGAYALGATQPEVALRVVVPGALSGIAAATVLALSRAVGETMAVTIAAGTTPNMTWNPFEGVQTLTAYIVQVSLGDLEDGSAAQISVFAVGALLFLLTLSMNVFAQRVLRHFREVYE